jgi:hypothetical protein
MPRGGFLRDFYVALKDQFNQQPFRRVLKPDCNWS